MPSTYLPLIIVFTAMVIAVTLLIRSSQKDSRQKKTIQEEPSQLPFPQHTEYGTRFLKPDHISQEKMDSVVRSVYQDWLQKFLLADYMPGRAFLRMGIEKRFLKYQLTATSVGQGYAMIISCLMSGENPKAQGHFDHLLNFVDAHPSSINSHLMSWQVTPDTAYSKPLGSFSQGDMLIAYALLMADRQWGSKGNYDYRGIADKIIKALQDHCIHPELHHLLSSNEISAEDEARWMGFYSADQASLFFKAFAQVSQNKDWQKTAARMSAIVERLEHLPGAFLRADDEADLEIFDRFDSETVPLLLHLALAAIFAGDASARALLFRLGSILKSASPDGIFVSEYSLNGTPQSKDPGLAIQAGMAVAAVCMQDQPWLNLMWDQLAAAPLKRDNPMGSTLQLMALLLLSGNWWAA